MQSKSPGNKHKSTLDCVDGYHGIELAEEDRHKTTFATECGKWRYRKASQGCLSYGDSYSRFTDTILEDCPFTTDNKDFEKIVDNFITWSETVEGAFHRICSLLSHCNKNGLVFNPDKFKFARREVEFAGLLITKNGIKPAAKYTETSPRPVRSRRTCSVRLRARKHCRCLEYCPPLGLTGGLELLYFNGRKYYL